MMRALFWIALVVLVVMAIRSKLRAAATRAAAQDPSVRRTTSTPPEIAAEPMSQCEFCGVYFPASETVRAEGHDYCSPAHARHTAP